MSEHTKCLLLCMKNVIVLLFTRQIMTHPVSWFFIRPNVFLKIHAHVLQNSPCKKEELANDQDPPKISFRQAALVFMSIEIKTLVVPSLSKGSIILILPSIYRDHIKARWWFSIFLYIVYFQTNPGEMIQLDEHIFSKWVGSTTN